MANRLAKEDSPYLQQHKDNPVDWYPWCDEAFERAQSEHKAIFISIGYSSCHWCHVMEHNVFEDEGIAKILNEHFISIKVDKEERPDIDKYYQEVHQLLNRRPGGWPTSIFATPENKAFFAGTYIAPKSENRQMGFEDLVTIIAKKVAENDEKLFENADDIQKYLQPKEQSTQATELTNEIIPSFIKQCSYNYENLYGGFSVEPKFPHTSTLNTLLSILKLSNKQDVKKMITHSLDCMILGGLYDHVDGGFCRYSTDTKWLVPHFEKMSYDNALLIELYTKASAFLKNERYLQIAKESADFMIEKMMHNDLFFSASDADSEGEEGKYFVYSYDEVTHLQNFTEFGITEDGNFEGKNIIRFDSIEIPSSFSEAKPYLQELRSKRVYPFIDKKVQVSWSSMMIKALFTLSKYETNYLKQAEASLHALLEHLYVDKKLYHTMLIDSTPKVTAFLEDYAYLASALIEAHQATFNESYLSLAEELTQEAIAKFYESGHWYFSRGEFKTEEDIGDGSYPSSVGVMLDVMLSLSNYRDNAYEEQIIKTLEFYSLKIMKNPLRYALLSEQVIRYLFRDRVIKSSHSQNLNIESYPFIKLQKSENEKYLICDNRSCFGEVQEVDEIDGFIKTTYSL